MTRELQALESLAQSQGKELVIKGRLISIGADGYDFSFCSWEEGVFGALVFLSALQKARTDSLFRKLAQLREPSEPEGAQ